MTEMVGFSRKVLAVASSGGHWEQLMLLYPMLSEFDLTLATTDSSLAEREGISDSFILISECNRNRPVKALRSVLQAWRVVRRVRPDFLITTGALPGLLMLVMARLHGAKTIWIDSVANAERPSASGRMARPFSSLWLTQWEHLAGRKGVQFSGSLL